MKRFKIFCQFNASASQPLALAKTEIEINLDAGVLLDFCSIVGEQQRSHQARLLAAPTKLPAASRRYKVTSGDCMKIIIISVHRITPISMCSRNVLCTSYSYFLMNTHFLAAKLLLSDFCHGVSRYQDFSAPKTVHGLPSPILKFLI